MNIRWIANAELFFVDFGNVRFSASRYDASTLAHALNVAIAEQDYKNLPPITPAPKSCIHGVSYSEQCSYCEER